jgi:glycosyltransferase involved in cell wall biosynthesis
MISVAIIAYNEEERLPECLASLSFADEIIVVDSNSSDRTVEIASRFGAQVFSNEWSGFGRQKQIAINRCSNTWVLVLDADERIPSETAREIEDVLKKKNSPCKAYSLPRKNFFLGRWIKHAGWWPDRVVRLVDKDHCAMNNNLVHESIEVQGETGELAHPIVHYATRNLAHTMEKMNRYSSAGAEEAFAQGEGKSSYGKAFSRGAWAFFYNYVIRLGFLDMGPGLVIAVSDAVNKFFKYAKLVEMQKPPVKADTDEL